MDPNANLEEQRQLRKKIVRGLEGKSAKVLPADVARLVELVEALDGWIASGGFLPRDWQAPVDAIGRRIQCTNTIGFKREGE